MAHKAKITEKTDRENLGHAPPKHADPISENLGHAPLTATVAGVARFATRNIYDVAGYLASIKHATTGEVYWTALAVNSDGKITSEQFGNGAQSTRAFDSLGRLTAITAGANAATQNLSYNYDNLGNILERKDVRSNPAATLIEDFLYDNLNRLTKSTLNSGIVKTYSYYGSGNIKSKSDFGDTYVYGENGAGPHAATTVKSGVTTVGSYKYDANGSMTQRVTGNVTTNFTYTAFNSPSAMAEVGGDYSNFEYDHNRARMLQTSNQGSTIYLNMSATGGTLYEKETRSAGGGTFHRHYIGNMIGAFVLEDYGTSRQENRQYFLKDHLGSTDVVMNNYNNGTSNIERLSFDPFGKRRLATNWTDSSSITASSTKRGFTGHEHLDDIGLIHMNGRVYDPQLGRFTSADPNIDGATSVQGFNRYSYVQNNPLSASDPTGFFKWSKFRDQWVKPIAAIAISVMSGGTLAGVMFGGFMSSLIMSGGDLKSACIGAFTAALFFGVGTYFEGLAKAGGGALSAPQVAGKVLAHGVVGGVSSKIQGGEFRDGFRSAAFTQAFAPVIDKVPGSNFSAGAMRVTAAAIVGGTASELGGGKFANGAVTGAFSRAFNDEKHRRELQFGGPDKDYPGAQNRVNRALEDLGTNGGAEGKAVYDLVAQKGLRVELQVGGITRDITGDSGYAIVLDPSAPAFIGETMIHETRLPASEIPTGPHADAIVLGHELGHAVYNYDDQSSVTGRISENVHFENRLRAAFGSDPRESYHGNTNW